MNNDLEIESEISIEVLSNDNSPFGNLQELSNNEGLFVYKFSYHESDNFIPKPLKIQMKFPALDVKGVWKPTADFSKRIEADWELQTLESRISIDAPLMTLFGSDDGNRFTVACSDTVSKIEMSVKYREEDDHFYATIYLFSEIQYPLNSYSIDLRFDFRPIPFYEAIKETVQWWEKNIGLTALEVPPIALEPLYSSWYQFHQNLDESLLLRECEIAKQLGFNALIIDDGWQTKDNNRGYDFTGDWESKRFENIASLVDKIHDIEMKVGLWFSVPFCGKKSKAYRRFKGKFLTENHRWAPVFDPRYPEVRDYLVETFTNAVKQWDLDGLKLDFIDDFKAYPDTCFDTDGKDTLSINTAVDKLLNAIVCKLKTIKSDIFIEFRQKYTGPSMRKYGNMLRAFDCPGDYTMNKVRITDIKLLSGNTAVHSDMVTWHEEEKLEVAALHYINTLFGVPQISIFLNQANDDHLKMIKHYNDYWKKNREVLHSENFVPESPMENYPMQRAKKNDKQIIAVYADKWVLLDAKEQYVDILNVKSTEKLVLVGTESILNYKYSIRNSKGDLCTQGELVVAHKGEVLTVPAGGMIQMERKV
ncbi:MAG: glycoside hydrolase family 36 protein [Flavobacteriaceae bacterium]